MFCTERPCRDTSICVQHYDAGRTEFMVYLSDQTAIFYIQSMVCTSIYVCSNKFTLYHTFTPLIKKKLFENIVGKGENAGYQHFLLFPRCFLSFQREIAPFEP